MQRITIAAIAAAALGTVLLTGCADPCTNTEPMYYNTEDGRYHYNNVGGPLVPDEDVKAGCAADQQPGEVDVDIDGHKVKQKPPAPAVPKQPVAPKPVPAPAPKAPAPKTGR